MENSERGGNTSPPDLPPEKSYAGQEATVRTGHGTTDWFQIGKRVHQGCIFSLCLFNFCAEYIMRNAGLEETQAGIKIVGRNINNLRYADDTTLMAESEEELKSPLVKVKVESEKVGLKLNIQKTKIMILTERGKKQALQCYFLVWGGCSVQFRSVAKLCLTLCNPVNHSTQGLPVHHQLPEFTQTHVHRVSDWLGQICDFIEKENECQED